MLRRRPARRRGSRATTRRTRRSSSSRRRRRPTPRHPGRARRRPRRGTRDARSCRADSPRRRVAPKVPGRKPSPNASDDVVTVSRPVSGILLWRLRDLRRRGDVACYLRIRYSACRAVVRCCAPSRVTFVSRSEAPGGRSCGNSTSGRRRLRGAGVRPFRIVLSGIIVTWQTSCCLSPLDDVPSAIRTTG